MLFRHARAEVGTRTRSARSSAVCQNFGIVDIGAQQVDISLFKRNRLEYSRTIFRQPWLP